MNTPYSTAPEVIALESGKAAKLIEGPFYSEVNDCDLVVYENDQIAFSLYWPSMKYYKDGQPHPLNGTNNTPFTILGNAQIKPGIEVIANGKRGRLNYVRMDHLSDLKSIAAVAVNLDEKSGVAGYQGSLYPANQVSTFNAK